MRARPWSDERRRHGGGMRYANSRGAGAVRVFDLADLRAFPRVGRVPGLPASFGLFGRPRIAARRPAGMQTRAGIRCGAGCKLRRRCASKLGLGTAGISGRRQGTASCLGVGCWLSYLGCAVCNLLLTGLHLSCFSRYELSFPDSFCYIGARRSNRVLSRRTSCFRRMWSSCRGLINSFFRPTAVEYTGVTEDLQVGNDRSHGILYKWPTKQTKPKIIQPQ